MSHTPSAVPLPERHPADLLTLPEVAEVLRASIDTLRWWRQQGKGPKFFKMGRNLVTTVEDVRQFIDRQRRGDTGSADDRPASA